MTTNVYGLDAILISIMGNHFRQRAHRDMPGVYIGRDTNSPNDCSKDIFLTILQNNSFEQLLGITIANNDSE